MGVLKIIFRVGTHSLMIVTLACAVYWLNHYLGGYSSSGNQLFSWHPTLMILAFIISMSQGILMYRIYPGSHDSQKFLHVLFQFISLILSVAGVIVIFKNHEYKGAPDMYSVHSYLGLVAIIITGLQFIFGLTILYFPGGSPTTRKSYMPQHRFFGIAAYVSALAAMCAGFFDLQRLNFAGGNYTPQVVWANVLTLFCVSIGLLVLYQLSPAFSSLVNKEDPVQPNSAREPLLSSNQSIS